MNKENQKIAESLKSEIVTLTEKNEQLEENYQIRLNENKKLNNTIIELKKSNWRNRIEECKSGLTSNVRHLVERSYLRAKIMDFYQIYRDLSNWFWNARKIAPKTQWFALNQTLRLWFLAIYQLLLLYWLKEKRFRLMFLNQTCKSFKILNTSTKKKLVLDIKFCRKNRLRLSLGASLLIKLSETRILLLPYWSLPWNKIMNWFILSLLIYINLSYALKPLKVIKRLKSANIIYERENTDYAELQTYVGIIIQELWNIDISFVWHCFCFEYSKKAFSVCKTRQELRIYLLVFI